MRMNNTVGLFAVVVIVVLAGCTGGLGGGASGDGGDASSGENGGNGGGASADWCPAGASQQMANPQTGERVSMDYQGIVERDGREVCYARWETNEGDIRAMDWYFSEDGEYSVMILYDENGDVVRELEMSAQSGE